MTNLAKRKMICALFPMMAMLLGSCTNPFNHGIGQVQEGTFRYDSKDETDLNPAGFDETTYFTVKKLGTNNFEEVKLENGQWTIYFEGGYHRIDWFNCPFASLPPFQQRGAIDYQLDSVKWLGLIRLIGFPFVMGRLSRSHTFKSTTLITTRAQAKNPSITILI